MKKSLLFAGAALAAFGAMAETPTPEIWNNGVFSGISKDGKYTVSNIYNMMLILADLDDKDNCFIYYDDDPNHVEAGVQDGYMPGFGTCVALDGSAVGNAVLYTVDMEAHTYEQTDQAVIFKQGEIIPLPCVNPALGGIAHAVTPDGSAICGIMGNASFSIDPDGIMQLPVVWYRNEDGTYAEPYVLPHPDKDFLGGVPQYVTAIAMSQDGNTIVGQVISETGFDVYPIVYRRDAEGKWSYTLPFSELYYTHPEVVIPENPGDCPEYDDFMTAEEIQAYKDALKAWQDAGGTDWSTYPKKKDFMTDEELAAYNAALQKWNTDKDAYDEAVAAATEGSIKFVFNNVVLSPDGKYFAMTKEGAGSILMKPGLKPVKNSPLNKVKKAEGEGDEPTAEYSYPMIFDIEANTYKSYMLSDGDLALTCAGKDGKFVGYKGNVLEATEAYVLDPEAGLKTLAEYKPAVSEWIDANMVHPVETYEFNEETGQYDPVIVDMRMTGIPFCTPDMSVITTYVYNSWDVSDNLAYGYVFRFPEDVSVKGVAADANGMRVLRDGMIRIDGQAEVEVFATDGIRVFRGAANGTVSTGLKKGMYIVRATFADGTVKTTKVSF